MPRDFNSKYRTIEFNDGFKYIYQKIKQLAKINNKKKTKKDEKYFFVPRAGLEPARTLLPTGF